MRDLVSWEIVSFVLFALGCSAWEWLRPGWRVDRLAGLKLDLVSFAVAVAYADGDRAEDYALGLGERIDPQSVPRMMLGV